MKNLALALALSAPGVAALCPFLGRSPGAEEKIPRHHPKVVSSSYYKALADIDFEEVQEDLKELFVTSQEAWPADYGNYGPFFIRLAWHCSGSYRTYDGRGGCDGGRQRFDPERSWEDNTNLDKARSLLEPVKAKYGAGLSWGDLFILAGTTAISSMGGPTLGFCGGRVDDEDGSESLPLGPSAEQESLFPCAPGPNGQCGSPLGSTTVGLIYLNPEGPLGNATDVAGSAAEVRDAFGRMAMNDSETVALIGGGHAFGKAHGACPVRTAAPPLGARAPIILPGWEEKAGGLGGLRLATSCAWGHASLPSASS